MFTLTLNILERYYLNVEISSSVRYVRNIAKFFIYIFFSRGINDTSDMTGISSLIKFYTSTVFLII